MIIATPLDVPKLQIHNWNKFLEIWNLNSKRLIKTKVGVNNSKADPGNDNLWIGLDIYSMYDLDLEWHAPFYDIKNELPELYHDIQNLPFTGMFKVRIIQSITDITPHTDSNIDRWVVRALLHCTDPTPQWYFVKPNNELADKQFLILPNDTNWFSYNDRYCWHGTIFRKDHPKFLLQIYMLDNPTDLINRSIERYKDFTIDIT
jgi:hypothetical protein